MQPYQEAGEEIQRQGELPYRALKTAATAATTVGGGLALSKILPFFSKYIPTALAVQGLNKIDPRFGAFIQKAINGGKTQEEALNFIKQKAEGNEPADNRNVVQKYSDKLHEFIVGEIGKGRDALQAGALAELNPDFKKDIDKMVATEKSPFSAILETTYGNANNPKANPQQPQEQQNTLNSPQPGTAPQNLQTTSQPQQPQISDAKKAFIAAIEKLRNI